MIRYAPSGPPRDLVFLFSDAAGAGPPLEHVADVLAYHGVLALVVDLPSYLKNLAASDDGCHYVVSELEELSKREQRALESPVYHSPLLAGVGAGATLAYAALAQAPAATLAGAVAVAPAASLGTRVKLCEGAPAKPAKGGGFSYGTPSAPLPGSYTLVPAEEAPDPLRALELALRTRERKAGPEAGAAVLARLPATVIPAAGTSASSLFAVIYSGDGGWRDLDKQIGEYLAARGVRVIGIDSLRYFWRARTPEEVASDLGAILREERARAGPGSLAILVGYSFGADVLPFAVNRLDEAGRGTVVQLSLLGLGSRAAFEFHLTGWLQRPDDSGLPVLPELQRIDPGKLQCFYGAEEPDTLCPRLAARGAEVIGTRGGHHFDGDYTKLAQRILDGALRRSSQRATTPAMPPEISEATSVSTKGTESPEGAAR